MSAGRGFLDFTAFATCRSLPAHSSLFHRELARLPDDLFVSYAEPHRFTGTWQICLLVLRWSTTPQLLDPTRTQDLCPESHRLLVGDRQILGAGFSRVLPGTRILRHAHLPQAGVLRFHLCLDGDAGAVFESDGQEVPLRAGHGFVFDHSLPHATRHDGPATRTCLIVDFQPSRAEAALLIRTRGGINLGPTAEPQRAVEEAAS